MDLPVERFVAGVIICFALGVSVGPGLMSLGVPRGMLFLGTFVLVLVTLAIAAFLEFRKKDDRPAQKPSCSEPE